MSAPATANPPDLARIRFVTRHYEMLHGLAALPAIAAVAVLIMTPLGGWGRVALLVAVVPAAFLTAHLIHRAYLRRFGWVIAARPSGRGLAMATFAVGVPAVAVQVMTQRFEVLPVLPISLEGVIVAAALFVGARRLRPMAVPFATLGVVGLVASLIPVAGGHPLSDPTVLVLACCGGALILAVAAHRMLVRTLS